MADSDKKEEKTKEMLQYEEETGRRAIWRGSLTEGFKKWKSGEKIYNRLKERIALYVDDEKKQSWRDFTEKNEGLTISKLVRKSVDFYIKVHSTIPDFKSFSKISHDLKEPLTTIKGYTFLLIENYKDKLNSEILFKLKEILEKCSYLENMITHTLEIDTVRENDYDILIIDDDDSAIKVLTNYFEFKGYKCKGMDSGIKIIEELEASHPKIVLIDIILPEVDGYEICSKIKSNKNLKNIPVFFITAIPGFEVEKKMEEVNADGYFLKPFDFAEFNKALDAYI